MTAKSKARAKIKLDARYSIRRCWTGYTEQHWVARFCDQCIGSSPNWRDAVDQAVAHREAFLAAITGAVAPAIAA